MTKEFYTQLEIFESYAKKNLRGRLDREPVENWPKQWYYSDGTTNEHFKLFLVGYSAGRCEYLNQ